MSVRTIYTTYTLLITVASPPGERLALADLEKMVERGLEEGVRGFESVESACASAVFGDHLGQSRQMPDNETFDRMLNARALHKALRE